MHGAYNVKLLPIMYIYLQLPVPIEIRQCLTDISCISFTDCIQMCVTILPVIQKCLYITFGSSNVHTCT